MQYLIISFATLVGTIFITPYFIDLFNKIKIVDQPDGKRKLHALAVPRTGGLLIFLVLITSLFVFYGELNLVKFFVFGAIVVFALGAYDDFLGAGWLLKFVYQFVSASLLVLFLLPKFSSVNIFGIPLPVIPASILLIFFIVGTLNSFNLLDGLDGLVSGISLLCLTLLFFINLNSSETFLTILLASIIGCMIGFLKYNAFPARIFLGDSGSYLLGYLLVSSAIIVSINKSTGVLDLTFPVILLAVPIADTIKVLIKRVMNGNHPFLADRTHIHHIVSSKNITHKTTVFIISIYSLFFSADAIIYRFYSESTGIVIFALLILPLVFANRLLNFMINREKLVVFGRMINQFPQKIIDYYKVGVVPATALFVLFSFILLLLKEVNPKAEFLIPSIFIVGFLIVVTITNYRKNKLYTDIIVFFNILIFFIINQKNSLLYSDISYLPVLGNLNYHLLIVGILLPVVGFFLLFRDRIKPNREMFFTGMDLTIILLVVLLSISSNIIPIKNSFLVTDTIFRSFIIYTFYKVMIKIEPKFRPSLYAFSFIIALLSQTILIFS